MQQGATLLSLDETMPQMLHEAITDARAWKRETLSWLVPFPQACFAELDAVVQFLRRYPQPVAHLRPAAFEATACASVMAHVHVQMHSHVGFVVVDRVPVERYSEQRTAPSGGYSPHSWGKWWPRSGMGPSCMMSKIPANPSGMVYGARSPIWSSRFIPMEDGYGCPVCHWSVLSPAGTAGRTE